MKKIIALLLILIAASVSFVLWGSYPILSGSRCLRGLTDEVRIERDRYGIPTIHGKTRLDVARATGFLHAQERFFQMDLMRRAAAGELSELFGEVALDIDKERRLHGFRKQSHLILLGLTAFEKTLLEAYTEGVNQGLSALVCKPFEYFILSSTPELWKPEDSLLVGLGLFFDLQDSNGEATRARALIHAALPPIVYQFLLNNGSTWDAPIQGNPLPILPIPNEEQFSYLNQSLVQLETSFAPKTIGSNQWAVSPSRTKDGSSILSNDMHLDLAVPTVWYRIGIKYKLENQTVVEVDGVSLPGAPLMIAGSNRHIAWGFTDAYAATTDLILLDTLDNTYLTPEGMIPFEERNEEIKIKGKPSVFYQIKWTKWGPVSPKPLLGKDVAIRWIAHDTDGFNCGLSYFETIHSAADALAALPLIHLPALNFMVADSEGHIGWGIVGGIPKRIGYMPGLPVSFSDGTKKWTSSLIKEHPFILDPQDGILWTANNRTLNNPDLGNEYANPIRAYQIKQRLVNSTPKTIGEMYELQLDDKALFFHRWRDILLGALDLQNINHQKLHALIKAWDETCASSSQGYFWIKTFREKVSKHIAAQLLAPCGNLNLYSLDLEEPIYMIASKQPSYFGPWKKTFTSIIQSMIDENLSLLNPKSNWGHFNIASIRHPLSQAIPMLSFWLDMPKDPLSGDSFVPRVCTPSEGASIRMNVSPGDEQNGIVNMPCGQSGHPFSKNYRDQHAAWVNGTPTPFLPGPTTHTLFLTP